MRVAEPPFTRGIHEVAIICRYIKCYSLIGRYYYYAGTDLVSAMGQWREREKRRYYIFCLAAACRYIYTIAREERLREVPIYDDNNIYIPT